MIVAKVIIQNKADYFFNKKQMKKLNGDNVKIKKAIKNFKIELIKMIL